MLSEARGALYQLTLCDVASSRMHSRRRSQDECGVGTKGSDVANG